MKKNKRITVTKITMDYGLDKIDIDLKIGENLEKRLTLMGEIYKILDNRRNVLKETRVLKTCIEMTGSIKAGYLLARRTNPIIIAILYAMEDKGKALLYLTGMINNNNWNNTNFLIEENFSNAKLDNKYMKLVKRYVESEKKHLLKTTIITDKNQEIGNKRKSKKIFKKSINKDEKPKRKMKNSAKTLSGKVKSLKTCAKLKLGKSKVNAFVKKLKLDKDITNDLNKTTSQCIRTTDSKESDR